MAPLGIVDHGFIFLTLKWIGHVQIINTNELTKKIMGDTTNGKKKVEWIACWKISDVWLPGIKKPGGGS